MAYALDDQLHAGQMRSVITLRAPTMNSAGDEIIDYNTIIAADVRAAKKVMRGRELEASGRQASEQWTEFRIRYQAGFDVTQRLDHDGREYDVESIDDPTGNRIVLVIQARAVK